MTNPYGTSLTNVRSRMSEMSAFQTFVGETTAADTLLKIFLWAGPPYETTQPPRVILDASSFSGSRRTTASIASVIQVEMLIEGVIPDENADTEHEQKTWFMDNAIDPLLTAIEADQNADGGLQISDWAMTLMPGRVEQSRIPTCMGDSVIWIYQHSMSMMAL